MGETFTESELENQFEETDADENGEVSYEEFLSATASEIPEIWWNPDWNEKAWIMIRNIHPCLSTRLYMWHSQILGSFEAKNTTCVFLHENSNMVIEITKDIFPDDKKYKKVQESGLKTLFCIF